MRKICVIDWQSYPSLCDTLFSVYSMIRHYGFYPKRMIRHYVIHPTICSFLLLYKFNIEPVSSWSKEYYKKEGNSLQVFVWLTLSFQISTVHVLVYVPRLKIEGLTAFPLDMCIIFIASCQWNYFNIIHWDTLCTITGKVRYWVLQVLQMCT